MVAAQHPFPPDPESRVPIAFEFDTEDHVVRLSASGVVTDAELTDTVEAMYADPRHRPGMHELLDCLPVTRVGVTPRGVRAIAVLISDRLDRHRVGWRIAIVTRSATIFALARMYQLLRDDSPEQVQVFRDLEPAEAWIVSAPRGVPAG